jgi:ATP-binding protein involved in chromosome partitioning
MTSGVRQRVPDVVAVASGKGGVGKSTVAVNLALALRDRDVAVGLLDADLHGPDVPRMLNLTRRRDAASVLLWSNPAAGGPAPAAPLDVLGIRVMSTQLLMGEAQAFAPEATFGGLLLKRFLHDLDWGDTELLIVDLPPGTGDVLQQLAGLTSIAGALIVVTPQDVAHLDARKVVALLATRGIRILGGVENMAPLACPHCQGSVELFPPTDPERAIWGGDVERLVSIPFDAALARADRRGRPVVDAEPDSAPATAFAHLARRVAEQLL